MSEDKAPTYTAQEVHGDHYAQPGDGGSCPGGYASLRDWFAGQVLPTVVAKYAADNGGIGADHLLINCPVHAYRIADAMLAERERAKRRAY